MRLIRNKLPRYFVLENVPGLLSSRGGMDWVEVQRLLSSLSGYSIASGILDATDYGSPQTRKRLFIVGVRGRRSRFPPPTVPARPRAAAASEPKGVARAPPPSRAQRLSRARRANCSFMDLGFYKSDSALEKYAREGLAPTITAHTSYYWNVERHRPASLTELLALQGFEDGLVVACPLATLKKRVGNSMDVRVVQAILAHLLS